MLVLSIPTPNSLQRIAIKGGLALPLFLSLLLGIRPLYGMESEIVDNSDNDWRRINHPVSTQPPFLSKILPEIPVRGADFDSVGGTAKTLAYDAFCLVTTPLHSPEATALMVTGVGALSGGTTQVDPDINAWVQGHSNSEVRRMSSSFKVFGEMYVTLGASMIPLTLGLSTQNSRARDLGITVIESGIYSALITEGLKDTFDRERPQASEEGPFFEEGKSFPSGHTTAAFSLASVYSVYYADRPWVSILAYGIAAGVGFSRMEYKAHWASDVIAGAAIGTYVGRTLANMHLGKKNRLFMPGLRFAMIGPTAFGLQLRF